MDVIDRLPAELMTEVFSYLSASDLISCARVCPQWNVLAQQFHLWSKLYWQTIPRVIWLDRLMVRNIDLSGVENITCVNKEEKNTSQSRARQLEQFFMRLYSSTTLSSWSPLSRSIQPPHADHQCTMFGPAIDQPDFSETFFRSLLRWVDVETCGRFLSENVPIRGSVNCSWAGLGLPLRLPNARNGEAFRLVILHARNKTTRASLPFGGDRVRGSSLVNANSSGALHEVTLTPEAALTISQSNSIVYTVDLHNSDEKAIPAQVTGVDRWEQMRLELDAVTSIMSEQQKLIILGLQRTLATIGNIPVGPYRLARQLEGSRDAPEAVRPLSKNQLNWRIWCTSADDVNCTHLEEIFSWLIQEDVLVKEK
ncbi:hypothetical protein D915_008119 [Fasciola hepatica]|uniref:F-box domain-containing protein n=1 Tax=Fasciola hepatica TaxID=6192 RepID=A0A4E0R162_FASHE|nr:hypothetical protein D915_008119 [Fasciola hepatica]